MAKFIPTTNIDEVYGEGDWRPLLGRGPREADWKLYMLGKTSIDHRLRGVILPTFDWEKYDLEDPALLSSIGPCWTSTADPKSGRHFSPNAFALPLTMYPYLGENKDHWLSPGNRRLMIGGEDVPTDELADAFWDLRKWINRNKEFTKEDKEFYLKGKTMRDDPLVPTRTVRYFAQVECYDKENDWHLAVIGITASAHAYIVAQMRWAHQAADGDPRDPDWPQYMLGDPTNPRAALEWHVDKRQLQPTDHVETNVICFTEKTEYLDSPPKVRKISQEALDARFNMVDPANWVFPTYEEQVEYMLNHFDGAVTIDMIRAACGYRFRGELPTSRPEHITVNASRREGDSRQERGGRHDDEPRRSWRDQASPTPPRHEEDDPLAAVTRGSSVAPPMPERRTPSTPAPVARPEPRGQADSSHRYFCGAKGRKAQKLTAAELQEMVDRDEHHGLKVQMPSGEWQTIEDCGLVTFPEPEAPMVPDDEAPVVPDDTPPTVPDDDEDGGVAHRSRDEMRLALFPPDTYDGFSPEQKVEAEAVVDLAWEQSDGGSKFDLSEEVTNRLMKLVP